MGRFINEDVSLSVRPRGEPRLSASNRLESLLLVSYKLHNSDIIFHYETALLVPLMGVHVFSVCRWSRWYSRPIIILITTHSLLVIKQRSKRVCEFVTRCITVFVSGRTFKGILEYRDSRQPRFRVQHASRNPGAGASSFGSSSRNLDEILFFKGTRRRNVFSTVWNVGIIAVRTATVSGKCDKMSGRTLRSRRGNLVGDQSERYQQF